MCFVYNINNDIIYDFLFTSYHNINISHFDVASIIITLTLSLELLQFRPKIMLCLLNVVENRLCAYEYNIVCLCHRRSFLFRR